MSNVDVSLIIPCFNEEASVPPIFDEIKKTLTPIDKSFEILFIDDGSRDNTLAVLRSLASLDSAVHFISFSRNFGKEAALLAGLQAAQGDYIVTMDADGQDPPSLIPGMLDAVASGEFDCAGTRRVTRKGEPAIRSFFAGRFYSLMKKISDIEVLNGARDFRLMNRKYLLALLELQERNRFSKGIFPWIGFKIKWFEYENIERKKGKTKWSFWRLFLYSLDGMTAFSSKPLAIASLTGFLIFLASVASIAFIVIRKLIWGDPVSGWTSTVCIILFCSGVQLFTTGILGQYAAKIYTEVKHRPHYLIREAQ
ncbi:MAG: glycosyltransferase family 2 protein [Treponema sp.]|nr:glycosyltransferase family 2 protein [Treponema sp.]